MRCHFKTKKIFIWEIRVNPCFFIHLTKTRTAFILWRTTTTELLSFISFQSSFAEPQPALKSMKKLNIISTSKNDTYWWSDYDSEIKFIVKVKPKKSLIVLYRKPDFSSIIRTIPYYFKFFQGFSRWKLRFNAITIIEKWHIMDHRSKPNF